MKDFPITVEVLSRFRTQAEQKRILKDVKPAWWMCLSELTDFCRKMFASRTSGFGYRRRTAFRGDAQGKDQTMKTNIDV